MVSDEKRKVCGRPEQQHNRTQWVVGVFRQLGTYLTLWVVLVDLWVLADCGTEEC